MHILENFFQPFQCMDIFSENNMHPKLSCCYLGKSSGLNVINVQEHNSGKNTKVSISSKS